MSELDLDRQCIRCGKRTQPEAMGVWRDADGEGHWRHPWCADLPPVVGNQMGTKPMTREGAIAHINGLAGQVEQEFCCSTEEREELEAETNEALRVLGTPTTQQLVESEVILDARIITLQHQLDATQGRERDALKAADTFAQDFHTAAGDRDRAKATLKDIREYVADLKGDPALTTRRNIADELTKILEYIR